MYEFRWSRKFFRSTFALLVLVCTTYAGLYFLIGSTFAPPGGNTYAVVLVWAVAHIGGFIAVRVQLPALMGMLALGVVLRNVPGDLLRGYKHDWESHIKAFGLATILFRAGLKIDYSKALRSSPATTIMLGLLPVFSEGFLDSAIFATVYGFPYMLAATAGFLLSAISPTVIVTGMLDLQKAHFGEAHGVPSVEMAAAGIDVVAGIAMYSIFEAIAVQQAAVLGGHAGGGAWLIARGPLSIPFGFAAAILGGVFMGCTKIFNEPLMRTFSAFALIQLFMFVFFTNGMVGAGALAAIGTASVAQLCWSMGWPRGLSLGPQLSYRSAMDDHLAKFWMLVMQPLLFGTIGASINFHSIPAAVIPKAILVIAVGSVTRMLTASGAVAPSGWTRNEMIFGAISWIPKATVQGALSSAPLDALEAAIPKDSPYYPVYISYGNQILATAVISIFVTAPIGLIIINMLGRKLLKQDSPEEEAKRQLARELEANGMPRSQLAMLYPDVIHEDDSVVGGDAGGADAMQSPSVVAGRKTTGSRKEAGRSLFDLHMCADDPLDGQEGRPVTSATQTDWDYVGKRQVAEMERSLSIARSRGLDSLQGGAVSITVDGPLAFSTGANGSGAGGFAFANGSSGSGNVYGGSIGGANGGGGGGGGSLRSPHGAPAWARRSLELQLPPAKQSPESSGMLGSAPAPASGGSGGAAARAIASLSFLLRKPGSPSASAALRREEGGSPRASGSPSHSASNVFRSSDSDRAMM